MGVGVRLLKVLGFGWEILILLFLWISGLISVRVVVRFHSSKSNLRVFVGLVFFERVCGRG